MVRDFFSDEVRVLIRPVKGYVRLMEAPLASPERAVLSRVLLLLAVIGAAGSFSSAGRLVLHHMLFVPVGWLALPLLQAAGLFVSLRFTDKPPPQLRALELYLAGNGPFFLFALGLSAVLLLASDVSATFGWLLASGLLVAFGFFTMGWSWLTSYGFYKSCAGCRPGKAARLVVLEWAVKIGLALVWYQTINNLLPQFVGTR